MRRGKVQLITFNRTHFPANNAATYIGLQAVHTAIAFFVIWVNLTIVLAIIQIPALWLWIFSYYPVLIAFLLGIPFITKTITKLYLLSFSYFVILFFEL
jgi:hypothetical protein